MYTVLYVDDEPDLLELGRNYLELSGSFHIITAVSAPDALEILRTTPVDCVVSDFQMPLMDGIVFLQAVRSEFGTLPFILFTGRGREEVVIDAINSGADFYLQKGGDPEAQFAELEHKIRLTVQRREAEVRIHDHEQREADILNFLPDATFAIDTNGIVIAWNKAMERMTGIAASAMLGKGNYEYALPFYHERRPLIIDLVLRPDPAAEARYPYIRKDGHTLFSEITISHLNDGRGAFLWFTATPLYNIRGEIVGAIESIREITERVQAIEAMHTSEARFRELADLLPQTVYEMDMRGNLTYVNQIAFEEFGYTREDFSRGLNIIQMIAPSDRERALNALRERFSTTPGSIRGDTYLAIKKDGTIFPISIYGSPILVHDTVTGMRGIVVDITESKRVERLLQNLHDDLRATIAAIPDLLFEVDREGVIYGYHAPVSSKLYVGPDLFLNKAVTDVLPPDAAAVILAAVREAEGKGSSSGAVYSLPLQDGVRWFELSIAVKGETGTPDTRFVILARDITERKQAEDVLRRRDQGPAR